MKPSVHFPGDGPLHQAKRCYEEALRLDPGYGAARSILRQVTEELAEVGGR